MKDEHMDEKKSFFLKDHPAPRKINMSLENGPFKRKFHVPTINFFRGQTSSFWVRYRLCWSWWAAMTVFPIEWRANGCNWGWWAPHNKLDFESHWFSNSGPADKTLGWLSGKIIESLFFYKGHFYEPSWNPLWTSILGEYETIIEALKINPLSSGNIKNQSTNWIVFPSSSSSLYILNQAPSCQYIN